MQGFMWNLMISQETGGQKLEDRLARAKAELMALRRAPGASFDVLDPVMAPRADRQRSQRNSSPPKAGKRPAHRGRGKDR